MVREVWPGVAISGSLVNALTAHSDAVHNLLEHRPVARFKLLRVQNVRCQEGDAERAHVVLGVYSCVNLRHDVISPCCLHIADKLGERAERPISVSSAPSVIWPHRNWKFLCNREEIYHGAFYNYFRNLDEMLIGWRMFFWRGQTSCKRAALRTIGSNKKSQVGATNLRIF